MRKTFFIRAPCLELARRNKHYLSPEGQKEDTTQEKVKMKLSLLSNHHYDQVVSDHVHVLLPWLPAERRLQPENGGGEAATGKQHVPACA